MLVVTIANSSLLYLQILWADTQRKLSVRQINDQLVTIGLKLRCLRNWLTRVLTEHDDNIECKAKLS
jgi:hypothetical protein